MTLYEHSRLLELYNKEKNKNRLLFRVFYIMWLEQYSFRPIDYLRYYDVCFSDVPFTIEERNSIIYSLHKIDYITVSCAMNNDDTSKICCGFISATNKGLHAFEHDREVNKF